MRYVRNAVTLITVHHHNRLVGMPRDQTLQLFVNVRACKEIQNSPFKWKSSHLTTKLVCSIMGILSQDGKYEECVNLYLHIKVTSCLELEIICIEIFKVNLPGTDYSS